MAVAKRPEGRQEELVVATSETRRLNQPFYQALERMLKTEGFAAFAEQAYCEFYAEKMTLCRTGFTRSRVGRESKDMCHHFH